MGSSDAKVAWPHRTGHRKEAITQVAHTQKVKTEPKCDASKCDVHATSLYCPLPHLQTHAHGRCTLHTRCTLHITLTHSSRYKNIRIRPKVQVMTIAHHLCPCPFLGRPPHTHLDTDTTHTTSIVDRPRAADRCRPCASLVLQACASSSEGTHSQLLS